MTMAASAGTRRMTVVRRTRLAVAGVAAVSVLLLAVALWIAWLTYTENLRTVELSRQVAAIASGLAVGEPVDLGVTPVLTGLRAELFEVEARLIGTHLVLTDADGAVRHSSAPDGTLDRYDIVRLTGEPDERGVRSGTAPLSRTGRVIIVAAPFPAVDGQGYLVAVQPLRELTAARRGAGLILLGVTAIVVLGAWFAGGEVARRVTAPLVRLTGGAEAIASGQWGLQVEVDGDQEVAALASAFNDMSARVDAAYTAQRDFVGDVSHEIRTPITSIQGFAGALMDGVASDEAERERFVRIIRQEAGRLMELTGTLLALADLDSGRVELEQAPIDVGSLAEALRCRHDIVAVQRAIRLEVTDLGAGGRPVGDEYRVLQVASALVTNALVHTPPGGTVRVSSAQRGGRWCLCVDDSGPGIPPEDRQRVFERFVRLDRSRSSGRGGSGLGLAICHRLVTLMGGAVSIEDSDLGGARLIVCLDRDDASIGPEEA